MDKISKLLIRTGMPPHMEGFEYTRAALRLLEQDRGYMGLVTRRLYPKVAQEYGATAGKVERAVRHAVEAAFDRMPPELQMELFGNSLSARKGKATNKEFLAVMLLHLEGEEGEE